MSNVCYIHPSSSSFGTHWVIPAGIFGLIELVRQEGFQVQGLNHPMELQMNPNFLLEEWIKKNEADYYLIDIHWFVHGRRAGELSRLIKEIHSKAKVIIGGLTASLFSEELMAYFPTIDYIINGDGEEPLPLLLKTLEQGKSVENVPNLYYRVGQQILSTPRSFSLQNFEDLSYANLDFLHNNKDYLYYTIPGLKINEKAFWLLNGRGCMYDCPCCGGAKNQGKKIFGRYEFLARDLEQIFKDINHLIDFDLDMVKFTHDLNAFGSDYYENFMKKYLENGLNVMIYNEFWQLPSWDFIEMTSRYGLSSKLQLAITVHSGNEKLRKLYGKVYSNQELLKRLEYSKGLGMSIILFFSRLVAEETASSLKETLGLIQQIKEIDAGSGLIQFCYEPIIVDPASEMTRHMHKRDMFYQYLNWDSPDQQESFNVYRKTDLSQKEIILDRKIQDCIER